MMEEVDEKTYAVLRSAANAIRNIDKNMHVVIIAIRADDDGKLIDTPFFSQLSIRDTAWVCAAIAQEVLTLDDDEEVDASDTES